MGLHKILKSYQKIRNNKQTKNFLIYGFGQAVNLISPLLVLPYIVSVCGESGVGKVGVGFSLALIAIVLVDYGSYINGTRQISINLADNDVLEQKFVTIYVAKFILLLCVLALCALLIVSVPFFEKDKLQFFWSLLIVVGQFINPTWFFQGIQNFKWISTVNVLSKLIYVGLVFLLIKGSGDYVYVNAFLGSGSLIAGSIGFLWICRKYRFSFANARLLDAITLIKDEFSLTVSQLFFSFYQYAPIMLISYVCGDFIAGQYRIIDQVIMIFRTYLQMFFNFIYAEICLRIHDNAREGLAKWKKSNGLNYLLILGLLVIVFLSTEMILQFFKVGPSDIGILAAYFKIGLLIPVFMGVSFALKQLMFAFNRNKQYVAITIFCTVFNLLLMFALLRLIGLEGAFVAAIVAECVIIGLYAVVLRDTVKQVK